MVPENASELYEMLINTPDLCGKFKFLGDCGIEWELYKDVTVSIGVNKVDGYIGIDRKLFGKIPTSITHWHPAPDEIYEEICDMGRRGTCW